MWRILFKRDYPDLFEHVTDPPGSNNMKKYYKNKLDDCSERGRGYKKYTYWKRYYELLQQPAFMQNHEYSAFVGPEEHGGMVPVREENMKYLPHPNDFETIMYIHCVFEENVLDFPVIRIFMRNDKVYREVLSSTKIRLSELVVNVRNKKFKGSDGIYTFMYSLSNILYYSFMRSLNNELVSSCIVCNETKGQLFTCSECEESVYCGEECQRINKCCTI